MVGGRPKQDAFNTPRPKCLHVVFLMLPTVRKGKRPSNDGVRSCHNSCEVAPLSTEVVKHRFDTSLAKVIAFAHSWLIDSWVTALNSLTVLSRSKHKSRSTTPSYWGALGGGVGGRERKGASVVNAKRVEERLTGSGERPSAMRTGGTNLEAEEYDVRFYDIAQRRGSVALGLWEVRNLNRVQSSTMASRTCCWRGTSSGWER